MDDGLLMSDNPIDIEEFEKDLIEYTGVNLSEIYQIKICKIRWDLDKRTLISLGGLTYNGIEGTLRGSSKQGSTMEILNIKP